MSRDCYLQTLTIKARAWTVAMREFESSADAYRYQRSNGGEVNLIQLPGRPNLYVVAN